jgi:hypothetical protein
MATVDAPPVVAYNWAPRDPEKHWNVTGVVGTDMPLAVVTAVDRPA